MLEREILMQELHNRLSAVEGANFVERNPAEPPGVNDLPAILIFEFPDSMEEGSHRGGYPIYRRVLKVVIESFINAASEGAATTELSVFIGKVRKAIYTGGNNLSRKAVTLIEVESSRVLRPPVGENVAGLGLVFEITYTENVANLFN